MNNNDFGQFTQCDILEDIHYLLEQNELGKLSANLITVDYARSFVYIGNHDTTRLVLSILLKETLRQFKNADETGNILINMKSYAKHHMLSITLYSNITFDHVCDVFNQFGASIKDGGLSFCRRTLQQMSGDLSLSTSPGKCIQFALLLPKV